MLYASELYRELPRARSVDVENDPDELPNLVAEVLTHAVERRIRRNLSYGYRRRQADLNRVRGRIDLLRTERRQLLQRGRVACSFEELTVDTPRNRFVKAALNLLRGVVSKDEFKYKCRSLATSMERAGVTGDPASTNRGRPRTRLARVGRLGADDREMLSAARLAFDLALPTEDVGRYFLPTIDREFRSWHLFERAVGGFYKVVLSHRGWKVRQGRWYDWQIQAKSLGIDAVLPKMQTDIVLEQLSPDPSNITRRIVIDTKFTSIVGSGHHRDQTLDSGHIYQIYAYLMSQEREADPISLRSTGILLHPATGEDFDEFAVIQDHKIRFATVDLAADSKTIRHQLLRAVDADTEPSLA